MSTKDEAARLLAHKHREIEVGISQILRVTGRAEVEVLPAEPIKLLEVNADTVPSGILPIYFAAAPESGIPFPTAIVEVTPEEFQRIQAKELELPAGWLHLQEIPPEPEPVEK
jgi:hypothetical protein